MKLPKEIKVAGHQYRVKVKNGSWGDDSRLRGNCSSQELEIKIDSNMPKSRRVETLLHEIGHAIYHEYNIQDEDREERTVTAFATGLHQVLTDNPALISLMNDG